MQRDFRLFEGLLLLFHGHTWDQTCESPFLQDNVAATRDVHVRLQNVACEQEVEHMQLATEAARQVSLADQSCVCDKLDFAVLQTAAKTPGLSARELDKRRAKPRRRYMSLHIRQARHRHNDKTSVTASTYD